ncbi:MAG: ATP-dependent metallopeptidase FtsH/Yme1/Tma family protein, partial [Actinobacteria bacterium]|nr:ATP-dependent metallopeptidase FtsH/Yme1/Tma family protein [Actinomycetota bacterium]
MKAKKFFRGPFFWILVAVLLVMLGSNLVAGLSGPKDVTTAEAVKYIQTDQVKSATLVDREQRIQMTLQDDSKVHADFITGQGLVLQEELQAKADAGALPEGYNVEVPKDNPLLTLLGILLPVLLIGGLLFFFLTQMQGGGSRI